MSPPKRFLWIALIVAFVGVNCPLSLIMAQGKTNGISVQIEDQWVQSNFGYKRIKVTVALSPRQPTPETLNLSVVVKQILNGQEHAVVTRPITLEQGMTSVEEEIYVPQISNVYYGAQSVIHVESDGNLAYDRGRDLAIKYNGMNYYGGPTGMPTFLIVSASVKSNLVSKFVKTKKGSVETPGDTLMIDELKFPSIQVLSDYYQDIQNQIGAVINNPTASDMLQSNSIHAVAPSDLPRSWLGLTSTEIMLISHNDLLTVSQDVQQMQAIRKWVAAGGSLIVFDCGKSLEKAASVRQLVDGRQSISAERKSPWRIPGEKLKKETTFLTHEDQNRDVYIGVIQSSPSNPVFSNKTDAQSARQGWITVEPGVDLSAKLEESGFPFAIYESILGRVTVVDDNMQNWTVDQWRNLLNANLIEGRTMRERMGAGSAAMPEVTMSISDVGQPPVNAFKVLIGLFVLVVGPISYFVLKKQRRLQLLFAIVPTISLLACLGLMLFAILSDGFQNRGRMRTFTAIDHAKQQAVSFSRHSHYQGVQPKDYRFGLEEAIFNSKAGTSPRSIYRQSVDGLSINGGDIRPRMPHQFVSVNSFETDQALILIDGSNQTAPQIRNQFETAVRFAILSTTAGVFVVENVAPGETATGTSVVEQSGDKKPRIDSKTTGLVRKLLGEISPDVKDQFLQLSAYSGYPYYNYGYRYNNSESVSFEADFQFRQLAGTALNELRNQPGHYIAILQEYTDITIPVDNIDYKNKIHIIHGKW